MKWGGLWGPSLWGLDEFPEIAEYCQNVQDRVLSQMDDSLGNRKFRDFLCELSVDFAEFKVVCDQVKLAFNPATAEGQQLDFIGSVVDLPRQGYDDDRYRTFLDIQISLLLSAQRDDGNPTGTINNVLIICRKFIGDAVVDPVILVNVPPYGFQLTVPGVTLSEMRTLAKFLSEAIYAGVYGWSVFTLASDSLWDSDAVAVTEGGIWGSATVVVAGEAIWGTAVEIGVDNAY